jgi:hypothetical protein
MYPNAALFFWAHALAAYGVLFDAGSAVERSDLY